MKPIDQDGVDWTGVGPNESRIEPLDGRTFSDRLRRLSDRAGSLTVLRRALYQQQPHGKRFRRDPDAGRPQDILEISELRDIQKRIG